MTESKKGFVPMKGEHLAYVVNSVAEYSFMQVEVDTLEKRERLNNVKHAYSYLVDGEPVCCMGIMIYRPGRAEAWAFFLPSAGKHFLSIQRAVIKYLENQPVSRLEAAVALGFERGHKWVKSLGFELEAERMRAFLPDGGHASLYARVV